MCGEHQRRSGTAGISAGSSPRVRGTRSIAFLQNRSGGIIPACAGNTYRERPLFARVPGSSPRVRGTPETSAMRCGSIGIIPACAGNTFLVVPRVPRGWDHPRVCGEHSGLAAEQHTSTGSSPRVRGTRRRFSKLVEISGIIPACAGNTSCPLGRACRPRDHPRVCGEHYRARAGLAPIKGSSPRVRGTPAFASGPFGRRGIIPACAGNTVCHWF